VSVFKDMHEARVVRPGRDYHELLRMLSEAISDGHVEQIPVMKPRPNAPNLRWYRDKTAGQVYSLDPPDERPGWWAEVDPGDPDSSHFRTAGDGTSGSVIQQRASAKVFWGILFLFLTPVFLFVKPVTKAAVLRDLLLMIWWAFILWLLATGIRKPRPTNSK